MSDNPLLIAPRERVIELFPGDTEQALADLLERVEEAEAEARGSRRPMAADTDKAEALAQQYDAEAKAARGAAVKVRLRDITDRAARKIQDECPKRDGNESDDLYGYNTDEFSSRLLRAMVVEPKVTDEQWTEFRDSVTAWNWAKLVQSAQGIHNGEVDLPKSSAVTSLRRMRANVEESSEPTR